MHLKLIKKKEFYLHSQQARDIRQVICILKSIFFFKVGEYLQLVEFILKEYSVIFISFLLVPQNKPTLWQICLPTLFYSCIGQAWDMVWRDESYVPLLKWVLVMNTPEPKTLSCYEGNHTTLFFSCYYMIIYYKC